jgi:hypothetical protein
MVALLCFFLTLFASPFKSKSRLEAENAALRHQLIMLQRRVGGRVQLTNGDRLFLVQLYRWFPSVLKVITIIRPETLVRWPQAERANHSDCDCWWAREDSNLQTDRYERSTRLDAGPLNWACAQEPWPYGYQWRAHPVKRIIIRGSRPA